MTAGFQHQTSNLSSYPVVRSAPLPQHVGKLEPAPKPAEPRSFAPARQPAAD